MSRPLSAGDTYKEQLGKIDSVELGVITRWDSTERELTRMILLEPLVVKVACHTTRAGLA